jgi:hypothetical protein
MSYIEEIESLVDDLENLWPEKPEDLTAETLDQMGNLLSDIQSAVASEKQLQHDSYPIGMARGCFEE